MWVQPPDLRPDEVLAQVVGKLLAGASVLDQGANGSALELRFGDGTFLTLDIGSEGESVVALPERCPWDGHRDAPAWLQELCGGVVTRCDGLRVTATFPPGMFSRGSSESWWAGWRLWFGTTRAMIYDNRGDEGGVIPAPQSELVTDASQDCEWIVLNRLGNRLTS
jgi:hypothetical protein